MRTQDTVSPNLRAETRRVAPKLRFDGLTGIAAFELTVFTVLDCSFHAQANT